MNEMRNGIKVPKSFWEKNKTYVFKCQATHTDETGKVYLGNSEKYFQTIKIEQPVLFQVEPMEGIPFQTEFTFSVSKVIGDKKPLHPLKCEFGYYNYMGKVVIPTNDTGDFLK